MVTDRQNSFTQSLSIFGSVRRNKIPKPPPSVATSVATSIDAPIVRPSPPSHAAPIDWNASGWIRVFCGPYRSELDLEESSRIVHVPATATTNDVRRELSLPAEYTLWLQTGGSHCRRLRADELPFVVQEEFCVRIGWMDASRRARLAIDPQLKHLVRFFVGPAAAPAATIVGNGGDGGEGIQRSGTVELLKGLVSPQWRRRAVAIVGSLLLVYPGE